MSSVEIRIPGDGGNPASMSSVKQKGENEFHVDLYRESWLRLKHSLSRMELICENSSESPQRVFFEVDMNPGFTQTFRSRMYIDGRGYVYVKSGAGRWKRFDGKMDGEVLKVEFDVMPGRNMVALSPSFGYGEYLEYVKNLPRSEFLEKKLWTRSAEGREVWMLEVTDPRVAEKEKLKVLIECRLHAYETFSSFSVQGILSFLLSGHPAANLEKFIYHIIPMANPDGVYNGWMYESSESDGIKEKLEDLLYERMQPHIAVRLHNWHHRKMDDVRYRHMDNKGRPLESAWQIFRSFLKPETEYGRMFVFDEGNGVSKLGAQRILDKSKRYFEKRGHYMHQWTAEIPWFGRDDIDPVKRAKEFGAKFINAVIQTEMRLFGVRDGFICSPYRVTFLSDLNWARAEPVNGNFPPQKAEKDRNADGVEMKIQGVFYERGLSLVPNMRVEYGNLGRFDYFEAMAGIDDASCYENEPVKVLFVVSIDGEPVWNSGPIGIRERKRVRVPLNGAEKMELFAVVSEDGISAEAVARGRFSRDKRFISANWADAKLIEGKPAHYDFEALCR